MTRPCKCGECAFFKNEDVNGYGHCTITRNHNRCNDLCEFKEDYMSKVETLRVLHHFQNGDAADAARCRIPLFSVRR